MKVRIKFAKFGIARFIGHLDVMRYFQKAIRRAGIAIRYSGGFSPHQLMSFAAPLGVGVTSNGEYLDIEVEDQEEVSTMKDRLNQVMAEGFAIKSCKRLPDKAGNAMSMVAAARYTLTFRPGYAPEDAGEWFKDLVEFYAQEEVWITKKTKKGEKELNLKPLIYQISVEDSCALSLLISTGSTDNIKPELVLDAYYQHLGQERPAFAFQVQREEVYARQCPEGHEANQKIASQYPEKHEKNQKSKEVTQQCPEEHEKNQKNQVITRQYPERYDKNQESHEKKGQTGEKEQKDKTEKMGAEKFENGIGDFLPLEAFGISPDNSDPSCCSPCCPQGGNLE